MKAGLGSLNGYGPMSVFCLSQRGFAFPYKSMRMQNVLEAGHMWVTRWSTAPINE